MSNTKPMSLIESIRKAIALFGATMCVCICLSVIPAPATAEENKPVRQPRTKPDAVRTLDAITIEGEIDVPQVLFITARDVRRYRDGLGTKFRKNSLEVARSVDLPTRLRIVAQNKEEGQ